MMKKIVFIILSLFLIFNLSANNSSSSTANRKTALRYLQLAKNYGTQDDWNSVQKLCQDGLQYDSTVADLHYLNALSLYYLEAPRFQVISAIKKSLEGTQWVDYYLSNARIFYADLLCDTGKPQEALNVLDSEPFIFSADAEFIRVKSLFQINTQESVAKAEEKVDTARRVYPKDVRFFYIFFNYEYNLCYVENSENTGFVKKPLSPVAQKIASSFILNLPNYDKQFDDLEILASFFAEDSETRKRLLKAFNARGYKHIFYPIFALKEQIISQEEAVDYFLEFINGKIDSTVFLQFATMITDENVKKYFDEHLNAFSGTLVYDTNNSLEENLSVVYERGRPKKATYDFNNDDSLEWEVDFDFGEPKKINIFDQNASVIYGTYPNVINISFEDVEPNLKGTTTYSIIDETYQLIPFDVIKESKITSIDFYVINSNSLQHGSNLFDSEKIILASNKFDKPSLERPNARIEFSVLNGKPYKADYYVNKSIYAQAQFFDEGEYCVIRKVDKDGDGIFEVVEYYSIYSENNDSSKNNLNDIQIKKDSLSITQNIWGSPIENAQMYLSEVKIDANLDAIFDFSEKYLADGTKITSWDTDFDTDVDVMYKKFPIDKNNILREENSYLIHNLKNEEKWITVVLNNKNPILIIQDQDLVNVFAGKEKNIYWLNQQSQNENEELLVKQYINQFSNGQVFQLEQEESYLRVIKIDDKVFIKRIQKQQKSENSLEEEYNLDELKNE